MAVKDRINERQKQSLKVLGSDEEEGREAMINEEEEEKECFVKSPERSSLLIHNTQ